MIEEREIYELFRLSSLPLKVMFTDRINLMDRSKKKLCIFLHYSPENYFPMYVQYYLNELFMYFDEVKMVTNKRKIRREPDILNREISIQFVDNEGYDFGMFYKAFHAINSSEYDQIACINDSNILFGELKQIFKWGLTQKVDFWGLVDSNENPWFSSHMNNYHIQSHFLVFNAKAIKSLPAFFETLDIYSIFSQNDVVKLRRFIVDKWEIGLSQFLLNQGLKSASFFDSVFLSAKYKSKGQNITFSLHKELIKEGYPLLKKKVALKKGWRSFLGKEELWEKLIKEYAFDNCNIPLIISEIKSIA